MAMTVTRERLRPGAPTKTLDDRAAEQHAGGNPERAAVRTLIGAAVELTLLPEANPVASTVLVDNGGSTVVPVAADAPATPGLVTSDLARTLGLSGGSGDASPNLQAPRRYDLVAKLGAGGMGEVHAARDRGLRRLVAMKQLLPEAAANRSVLGRFLSEAQITSQLDHPNVVPIYGLEVTDSGTLAYAMKMIHGEELADIIQRARDAATASATVAEHDDLAARLEIFVKVCDAIAFAHDKGVLHRDLKPANIMVGQHGEVYVVDWGIARLIGQAGAAHDPTDIIPPVSSEREADGERTRIGQALGTPLYMSPEQARGDNDRLDQKSDIFTLGLILQELVTLQRAREGTTFAEILLASAEGQRRPFTHIAGRRLPRELRAIVDKASAVLPEARYASAVALADDVRRYLRGDAVHARPDTPIQRAGRWLAKHRTAALVLLVLLGGVVPLGGVVLGLLAHDAQMEKKHRREEALTTLVAEVAQRAAHLDAELHAYEAVAANAVGSMSAMASALSDPSERERATRYLTDHVTALVRAAPASREIERLRVRDGSGGFDLTVPPSDTASTPTEGAGWTTAGRGDDLRVRFVAPVLRGDGAAAGTVVLDVAPETLRDDLDIPATSAVFETLLMRPDGGVVGHVVHGPDASKARATIEQALPPKLAGSASDWLELDVQGRDLLIAWHKVAALDWYYVVVVDIDILEAHGFGDLPPTSRLASAR
jgi:serine/threonine protein kinase